MKLTLGILLLSTFPLFAVEPARILIVASNDAFDLGELAQAHQQFELNDFVVDIATPSGGTARPKAHDDLPVIQAFLAANPRKLEGTLAIADVDVTRYAAMFLVGGSGAMFEFPSNAPLQKQIAAMADRGAVVAAVCHGPAALRDVKLADGTYLVAGKRVSAFTEEEEALFGGETAKTYPFVLERSLRDRGALFRESPVMLVQVSRDGLLVTGQNPFSTPRTVDEVIRALGRTPKPRQPDRYEGTILLIAELRSGDAARAKLDAAPQDYDLKLLGMYGARLAGSAEVGELRHAITLMEAASRHLAHPKLKEALDRARLRLARENDDNEAEAPSAVDRRSE